MDSCLALAAFGCLVLWGFTGDGAAAAGAGPLDLLFASLSSNFAIISGLTVNINLNSSKLNPNSPSGWLNNSFFENT